MVSGAWEPRSQPQGALTQIPLNDSPATEQAIRDWVWWAGSGERVGEGSNPHKEMEIESPRESERSRDRKVQRERDGRTKEIPRDRVSERDSESESKRERVRLRGSELDTAR